MAAGLSQFLFAFTSNGFVNHMRANRQPLLDLLLLSSRRDSPFACGAFVFAEFLLHITLPKSAIVADFRIAGVSAGCRPGVLVRETL